MTIAIEERDGYSAHLASLGPREVVQIVEGCRRTVKADGIMVEEEGVEFISETGRRIWELEIQSDRNRT